MSKAWITIVADDLNVYLVSAQVTALRTAALKAGQTDPVEEAIEDISNEIRNRCRACSSNVLSATAGTIPPELKRHACALIIEAAQPRLKLKLNEDQIRAANNARTILKDVGRCDYPISDPTDPETTPSDQGSGSRTQVYAPRTPLGRNDLDGL